jgi:hypothetical protein
MLPATFVCVQSRSMPAREQCLTTSISPDYTSVSGSINIFRMLYECWYQQDPVLNRQTLGLTEADWPVEIARLVHEEGERYPRLPGAQMML